MGETTHFVNEGFGWECRRCRGAGGGEASQGEAGAGPSALPRFFREGEAEGGGPRLSSRSLARWADETRAALRCPVCGAEEEFKG